MQSRLSASEYKAALSYGKLIFNGLIPSACHVIIGLSYFLEKKSKHKPDDKHTAETVSLT